MLFTLQAMSFNLENFQTSSVNNYVLGNESIKKDLALTKGKIKIKNNVLEKVTEKQAGNTRTCKLLVSDFLLYGQFPFFQVHWMLFDQIPPVIKPGLSVNHCNGKEKSHSFTVQQLNP